MAVWTHAITINTPPEDVWPWLAQLGAGRAGWYSFDFLDNGGRPSAADILSQFQEIAPGDVLPAVPGTTDAFGVAVVDPPHELILIAPAGAIPPVVSWTFRLNPREGGRTRLLVRARASGAWRDLIRAVKDPLGANLDRVQVVKGWLDADDEAHERIYNVALSDGRTVAPVGSTVDLETATYDNSIGSAQLVTVWEDPDFDPEENALYCVRVLEIPTPRHSTYDAVALEMDPTAYDRDPAIQERAYSSPIWYTP